MGRKTVTLSISLRTGVGELV